MPSLSGRAALLERKASRDLPRDAQAALRELLPLVYDLPAHKAAEAANELMARPALLEQSSTSSSRRSPRPPRALTKRQIEAPSDLEP